LNNHLNPNVLYTVLPAGLYSFSVFMFANLSVSVGLQALLQILVCGWQVRFANVPAIASG
jgi:hypothetical protein